VRLWDVRLPRWFNVEDGQATCLRCGNGGPLRDHGPGQCPNTQSWGGEVWHG
jgi:hypothetical protein